MTGARIIAGDFADIRTVKTRSTVQMIIEVPIEEGETIIKMFGFPQPANPVRVAVARLNAEAKVIEHKQWADLPLSQQAGIRCGEARFWKFLRDEGGSSVDSTEAAATYVRLICGVNTRAEFVSNKAAAQKWRDLDARFQAWRSDPVPA